jgi:hypothetical protein
VFQTQRLIEFYISRMGAFKDRYRRNSEKRWFRINMKICGIIFMVSGTTLFLYAVKLVFK